MKIITTTAMVNPIQLIQSSQQPCSVKKNLFKGFNLYKVKILFFSQKTDVAVIIVVCYHAAYECVYKCLYSLSRANYIDVIGSYTTAI